VSRRLGEPHSWAGHNGPVGRIKLMRGYFYFSLTLMVREMKEFSGPTVRNTKKKGR
jgi:hypothetical protein